MSIRYAQLQPFTLAGSGSVLGDTSITLTSFNDIDGNALSMSDFGSKGFGTLEPGSAALEESISFSGITTNTDGSVTITGIKNVKFTTPYTETSGLQKIHAGGIRFVITNTAGFYNTFSNKLDDESITGSWTFDTTPTLPNVPVAGTDAANKTYVDNVAVSGAPDANITTKGIVQIATAAQIASGTATGSTGAILVPPNSQLVKVSSGTGDENKLPVIGSGGTLASGFLPVTEILKGGTGQTTKTAAFDALSPTTTKGDLIVSDGTNNVRKSVGTNNQVLISDSAQTTGIKWASTVPGILPMSFGAANGSAGGTQTIAHGLGTTPSMVLIDTSYALSTGGGNTAAFVSHGSSNGTNNSCAWAACDNQGSLSNQAGADTSNCIHVSTTTATITLDATNITINWTNPSTNAHISWKAFA